MGEVRREVGKGLVEIGGQVQVGECRREMVDGLVEPLSEFQPS